MVKFGVGIVPEQPTGRLLEIAKIAEELGYSNAWVADERFFYDCYCNMTNMAVHTEKMKFGTCVTDPFSRHPAMTAVAIATLDEISGGRAILGMGAGVSGFANMGIIRKKPAKAIKEAIQLIRALWAGETLTFEGELVKFHEGKINFKARPDIPIFVGARGPKILEVGGELADGVIIGSFASEPGIRYALDHIGLGAARAGRSVDEIETVSWLYTSVSDDEQEAIELVKKGIAVAIWGSKPILDEIGIKLPKDYLDFMENSKYTLSEEVITQAMKLIPDEIVEHFSIAGPPEKCAQKIVKIIKMGIKQIAIWPFPPKITDVENVIRPFAEKVIPRVKELLQQ